MFAEKGAKCDILSLEECKQVNGARLQTNPEMVEAALILFHHQNTRTAPLYRTPRIDDTQSQKLVR